MLVQQHYYGCGVEACPAASSRYLTLCVWGGGFLSQEMLNFFAQLCGETHGDDWLNGGLPDWLNPTRWSDNDYVEHVEAVYEFVNKFLYNPSLVTDPLPADDNTIAQQHCSPRRFNAVVVRRSATMTLSASRGGAPV